MKFKTFLEAHDAYLRVKSAWPTASGIPEREKAFLAMADVPVLAVDNHGYKYPVCIVDEGHGPVLYCIGTPSGWALPLLTRKPFYPDVIAFDLGQNWNWINVRNVLRAVPAEFAEEA